MFTLKKIIITEFASKFHITWSAVFMGKKKIKYGSKAFLAIHTM